jgi:hypothetical protein
LWTYWYTNHWKTFWWIFRNSLNYGNCHSDWRCRKSATLPDMGRRKGSQCASLRQMQTSLFPLRIIASASVRSKNKFKKQLQEEKYKLTKLRKYMFTNKMLYLELLLTIFSRLLLCNM